MQVFIAYAFRPRNSWIEEMVFPLLVAMECVPMDGHIAYGAPLSQEITDQLQASDAVLAFITKPEDNEPPAQSRWVDQELGATLALRKPLVEIVESGATHQAGAAAALQKIEFEMNRRDACLVEIARAIKYLRSRNRKRRVKILPPESGEIYPLVGDPGISCNFRWRRKFNVSPPSKGVLWTSGDGKVFVDLEGVGEDDLIQIDVDYGNQRWVADYQPIDEIGVRITRKVGK